MMTPTETALRDRLHELADQPAPPSLADRALAGARRARRRQAGLVAGTALVLASLVAVSNLGSWRMPVGTPAPGGGPCELLPSAAAVHPGEPDAGVPAFVHVVLAALPYREDYVVRTALGMCGSPVDGSPVDGARWTATPSSPSAPTGSADD